MSASSRWATSRVTALILVGLAGLTGALVSTALDGWDWGAAAGYLFAGCLVVWLVYLVLDRLERRAGRERIGRRDAEESLLESERKFRTLFESSGDAVMWLDESGFVGQNGATLRIFGCETAEQFLGRRLADFSPSTQPGGAYSRRLSQEHITRALQDGSHGFEWQHRRLDGREFPAHVLLSAMEIDGRKMVQALVRDITRQKINEAELQRYRNQLEELVVQRTEEVRKINVKLRKEIVERKRIEEALRGAMLKAEEGSRAKSEFLANMSHEIRTPLNGMIGMTSLLSGSNLPAEPAAYVETVRACGSQLLRLVNDILDFSKIEAGKLDLEVLALEFCRVVEEAVETVAIGAEAKGVELLCWVDPAIPDHLLGDPARIRQVLNNLLSNAVKFTAEGLVSVQATVLETTEHQAVVKVEVRDTGVGIPEERLGSIFESFTQADGSTTRQYGGTGLGLTISNRLIQMMNGMIEVDSEVGHGSNFSFTVPLARSSSEDHPAPDLAPRATTPGEVRVLVAGGSAAGRETVLRTLTGAGFFGREADTVEAAARALSSAVTDDDPFQIVILDTSTWSSGAKELGESIRDDESLGNPALMLLTPIDNQAEAEDVATIPVHATLAKPAKRSLLLDSLHRIARGDVTPVEGKDSSSASEAAPSAAPPDSLRILLVEDNQVNQKVALRMLEKHLGLSADVAQNGLEALEALTHLDYDLVLMDCQMPQMDGYEATNRIRCQSSSVRNHDIPIIAMTANAMDGDRERCLEAGMNGYVSKPIHIDHLGEAIRECVFGELSPDREG